MKLLKGLTLASLATPILVFLVIVVTGSIFSLKGYFESGVDLKYIGGGVIGGAFYSAMTAVVSIPATIIIGYPLSKYAIQKGNFISYIVIIGASISGAISFVVFSALYFPKISFEFLFICFLIGLFGGLCNGSAYWMYMKKSNISLNQTSVKDAHRG